MATSGGAEGLMRLRRLGLALTLGLFGTLQHELVEFGYPSLGNSVSMALLFSILFVGWWQWRRARRAIEVVLLVLATVMLLGGAVASVIPLAVWPFVPAQTPMHYVTHLVWLLCLVGMMCIIVRDVRPVPALRSVSISLSREARVVFALALSFGGLLFHNLREFPLSVLVRGDTLILLAITVSLGVWWCRSRSRWARAALLAWGLLHVIGGGLIVGGGLPLLISDLSGAEVQYVFSHHLSHWIYGAASLPLVWVAWRMK